MSWLQTNRGFAVLWLGVIGAVISEGWVIQRDRGQVRQLQLRLQEERDERERLVHESPAPTPATRAAIEKELEQVQRSQRDLEGALVRAAGSLSIDSPSSRSVDAYFEIATFVGRMRASAGAAGMRIRADDCFSFSLHRSEGPAWEFAPVVLFQARILEQLLTTLIEAHPRALLDVRRELPAEVLGRGGPNQAVSAGAMAQNNSTVHEASGDFFHPPERGTVLLPDSWRCQAFRLEFTGSTDTLRQFLNRLVDSPLPLAVREVETFPSVEEAPETMPAHPRGQTTGSIIGRTVSRFVVTVDFFERVEHS